MGSNADLTGPVLRCQLALNRPDHGSEKYAPQQLARYTSRFARKLMAEEPPEEFAGFFETRS